MVGGNINPKRSWHPIWAKNAVTIWNEPLEEAPTHEERLPIERNPIEISEERQMQNLQCQMQNLHCLQDSQGGKPESEHQNLQAAPESNKSSGHVKD